MNTIKNLKLLPVLLLALSFFSCNNSGSSNSETAKTDTSVTMTKDSATPAPAAAASAPAIAVPFDVVEILHKVKSYATWKPEFNADSANRLAAGLHPLVIGLSMNDSNNVLVILKADDIAKAKDFSNNPQLKDAMKKAGVVSHPTITKWHIIRFNTDSHEKQWVEITHKVKNFDTWLKAFDGEGTAQRATEGCVDVALARGIDDSNMVKVVLDVSDMAKAKAAIFSDAKKKLMMDAGVEGKPTVEFYKEAE